MNMTFFLMAQYQRPLIPVDRVLSDYFSHLSLRTFLRKCSDGEIALPLVNMEPSQKSAKGVHIEDLARYLEARTDEARKDFKRLHS